MILKLLLIIVVITIVYVFFFKKKSVQQTTKKKQAKREKPIASDTIECPSCGIYCEVEEAILSNGKYYCSSECINKAS